jgi:phosphate transport system substrate-binding protein
MVRKALFGGLLLAWQMAGLAAGETLTIPGTGASEAILRALAGAFKAQNPGKEVLIPPGIGSHGGLRQLANNQCELARIILPPGKNFDPGIQCRVFARDALVFAVGANIEVRSLTAAQLAAIFSGKITDWQEVGGRPGTIRVLAREERDASIKTLRAALPEFQNLSFSPACKVIYSDGEMVAMLKKYKNSIGMTWVNLIQPDNSPKALGIDGLRPNYENLISGRYRLSADLALCYKSGGLSEMGVGFVGFIFSDEGQAIIKNAGAVPAQRK